MLQTYRGVRQLVRVSTKTFLARKQPQRIHGTTFVSSIGNYRREAVRFHTNYTSPTRHISTTNPSLQVHIPPVAAKMVDVETVLKAKYPAKAHAKRVVEWMKKQIPDVKGVLYLEGQKTRMIEDNDGEMPFRFVLPHLST